MTESGSENARYCAAEVERADPDRFLTAMMARDPVRRHLLALYAFNLELAKIPDTVSEPLIGQMRLTWWRDAIEECYGGKPRNHAVVNELAITIPGCTPPKALFSAILDGREADALGEPPPNEAAFTLYLERTAGAMAQLGTHLCGASDETTLGVAKDVGVAQALVGLVRSIPFRRRLQRPVFPADLLLKHGLQDPDGAGFVACSEVEELSRTLLTMAEENLRRARTKTASKVALPVLLTARVVDRHLTQLRKVGCNPFDPALAGAPLWRTLSVGWGALSGRW